MGELEWFSLLLHPCWPPRLRETPLSGSGPWPCCPGPSLEEEMGVPASFLPPLRHAGAAPREASQPLLEPLSPEVVHPTPPPLFRVAGTSVPPHPGDPSVP